MWVECVAQVHDRLGRSWFEPSTLWLSRCRLPITAIKKYLHLEVAVSRVRSLQSNWPSTEGSAVICYSQRKRKKREGGGANGKAGTLQHTIMALQSQSLGKVLPSKTRQMYSRRVIRPVAAIAHSRCVSIAPIISQQLYTQQWRDSGKSPSAAGSSLSTWPGCGPCSASNLVPRVQRL